jgi:DtxR family Mn-dependent transcriptional regulator
MSHDADLADQDVEEIAEELWTLGEEGRCGLADLRAQTQVAALDAGLEQLAQRGLARLHGDQVTLTEPGRALAERQVRRHRLAEALFTTVLEVRDDRAVNRTACVMEHVLDNGLADSICAFLGHPRSCPHGKPIPPGPCCRVLARAVPPLVQPLTRLAVGEEGRIVYIAPRDRERLVQLANLGVTPGARIHLQQVRPAAVVRVGETTLALDPQVAEEIYVKPTA